MNLSELSIDQLKALSFDQIQAVEQAKSNLSVLYAEIAKRSDLQTKEVNDDKQDRGE